VPVGDIERPRRVVSGTNSAGRSYYARVEDVDAIDAPPGAEGVQTWQMWRGDRLPDLLPTDGLTPPFGDAIDTEQTPEALRRSSLRPEPLGYVASVSKIAPTAGPSRFHWHTSLDVIFVMAGELEYLLDGGDRIDLRPGDVVIQHGSNHAWHNSGNVPAVLGTASIGAAWFGPAPPAADRA
jgi:quercetin dioxygenase-like cupin family protein